MNIFDFENRVKSASNNIHYNVDIEGLLNDLNIQKKPASPFRRLLPYFGISSLLLVSSLIYFTYTPNKSIDTKSIESVDQKSIEINNSYSGSIALNQKVSSFKEKQTSIDAPDVNKSISTVSLVSLSQSIAKTKSTLKTSINKTISEDELISKNKFTLYNTSTQSEVISLAEKSNQESNFELIQESISLSLAEKKDEILSISEVNKEVSMLPLITSFLEDELPRNLHKKVADCPKFTDGNWNFAIVPEFGIVAPLKTLSLKDENFQTAYDDRLENENSQFSFQAGIGFQFKNKRTGLYFKPGISYTRIDEQYKTAESFTGQISEVRKANYQLHQFDIPVAIGSSIKMNKLSIDIEGGLKFNFLQQSQGSLYQSDGNFVSIEDRQPYFKESIGLGFFAGAMLKKQINPFSELYIGPRFSFNTLATSSNQNPIHQRYSFVGVHAGLIHTLF